jgi:hypothetical protein
MSVFNTEAMNVSKVLAKYSQFTDKASGDESR